MDFFMELTHRFVPNNILETLRDRKQWPWDMPEDRIWLKEKRKEPEEPASNDTEAGGDRKRVRS